MYHFQARYYDPNIGRFTQPDPSGQEENPYLYAEGDPVNRIDPTGLFSFSDVMDIGEKVVTAAVGCVGGVSLASDTGVLTASTMFFGTPGTVAAVAGSCIVGAGASLMNADLTRLAARFAEETASAGWAVAQARHFTDPHPSPSPGSFPDGRRPTARTARRGRLRRTLAAPRSGAAPPGPSDATGRPDTPVASG
ncbi:RHS repeat-associated core domain-containing protein [Streptomyces sp. NPDC057298]|uniref:RHS repeat-associated core domain-containing protein n=1 Tax=Streptomyces sp. NPDC057298 TaxID=3346091 RepID=UPI00363D6C67